MIEYPNYHKALIVTGDGDFYRLVDYLIKHDKLLKSDGLRKRYLPIGLIETQKHDGKTET